MPRTCLPDTLGDLLTERGISHPAAAVLAGVDTATIWRMVNGKLTPKPATVVKLAKALGVDAKRMQAMCDQARAAAQDADRTPAA